MNASHVLQISEVMLKPNSAVVNDVIPSMVLARSWMTTACQSKCDEPAQGKIVNLTLRLVLLLTRVSRAVS